MKKGVWIFFAVALLVRILLALITPLEDEAGMVPYFNDERAHLNYVKYIAHNGRLPVQVTNVQDGFELSEYEYYQAPLYYLLVSPFYTFGETLTPGFEFLWVRLISVLFSMGGLFILYLAVRRYFGNQDLASKLVFLAAFLGVPMRYGSLVTNDSLLLGIACLYLALILQILSSPADRRLFPIGILLAAAGLWTKASFLVLLPILPLAFLCQKERSIKKAIGAFLLPILIILPWIVRNFSLYGNFISIQVGYGPPDPVTSANVFMRLFYTGDYFVRSLIFPFDAFWGGILDHPVWIIEAVFLIFFGVLGLVSLRRINRTRFWFFILTVGLNAGSYLIFNTLYFEAEARLIIPALPFLLVLLTMGANRIASGKTNLTYGLLGFWLVLPWFSALFR